MPQCPPFHLLPCHFSPFFFSTSMGWGYNVWRLNYYCSCFSFFYISVIFGTLAASYPCYSFCLGVWSFSFLFFFAQSSFLLPVFNQPQHDVTERSFYLVASLSLFQVNSVVSWFSWWYDDWPGGLRCFSYCFGFSTEECDVYILIEFRPISILLTWLVYIKKTRVQNIDNKDTK